MMCACVTSLKLEQEIDVFLMDKSCAKTKDELSDPIIRTINYYRSYLEVKFFLDICTADGHYILPSVLQGHQSIDQSTRILPRRSHSRKIREQRVERMAQIPPSFVL